MSIVVRRGTGKRLTHPVAVSHRKVVGKGHCCGNRLPSPLPVLPHVTNRDRVCDGQIGYPGVRPDESVLRVVESLTIVAVHGIKRSVLPAP